MVGVVEPAADEGLDVDSTSCLPNPKTPNYAVYKMVFSILGVTFFLTFLEAYLLRLQHIVANMYYPHRERARAVWLYNHILIVNISFKHGTCTKQLKQYLKCIIGHRQ
ncbi:DC-STAMP domain-containing protein 2 [Plakobranchus ocellatus]|uniref:DC-STAMP domain-containing protein 2 n=1 Tax=Plakobranchus ocellatus TaxID=259542 RepID=A0AAV4B6A4_9GAST|nr:DC-STAMP domain-containing protein 2 [Plakobranchus ocellatus]